MNRPVRPYLVAIVGGSGAGKNWLADRLQSLLGDMAGRVSLDSFYRDRSYLPPARRAQVNYDHPRAIDWDLVEAFLRDCRAGRPARIPHYDFATHARGESYLVWQPCPIVLFDGLWLLARPRIRQWFDFSIFIQCASSLRLRQRLARDVAERGREAAMVRRQFHTAVEPMHRRWVAPQQALATMVLRQPLTEARVHELAGELWDHLADGPWAARSIQAPHSNSRTL